MDWFAHQLRQGLEWEDIVSGLLSQIPGLHITQLHAKAGVRRGPRVHAAAVGTIDLPAHDIHAVFASKHFDIQVKSKGDIGYFRKSEAYTHGIDLPVFDRYKALYRSSDTRMWLVVVERKPPTDGPGGIIPSVLAQWFHKLMPRTQRYETSTRAFPQGMAFWPRDAFLPIMNATMSPPTFLMQGATSTAHLELRREFLARPQLDLL